MTDNGLFRCILARSPRSRSRNRFCQCKSQRSGQPIMYSTANMYYGAYNYELVNYLLDFKINQQHKALSAKGLTLFSSVSP